MTNLVDIDCLMDSDFDRQTQKNDEVRESRDGISEEEEKVESSSDKDDEILIALRSLKKSKTSV